MKATIGHIGINFSSSKAALFWKDLFQYLGLEISPEEGGHFHASDGTSYFCANVTKANYKDNGFHRKHTGLNHIAFNVSSRELVDQFVTEFLIPRKIKPLYGGVKAYPDYAKDYYAVYFEDPDRIKIEVVYEIGDN